MFQGIFLDDHNRIWDAVLKGGWLVNSTRQISWMPPPSCILKLSFDWSFHRSSRRGGIGGVIRDRSSNVVRSFFGLVEASNANEA